MERRAWRGGAEWGVAGRRRALRVVGSWTGLAWLGGAGRRSRAWRGVVGRSGALGLWGAGRVRAGQDRAPFGTGHGSADRAALGTFCLQTKLQSRAEFH